MRQVVKANQRHYEKLGGRKIDEIKKDMQLGKIKLGRQRKSQEVAGRRKSALNHSIEKPNA